MKTKTYARVADGVVVELLETAGDISAMFHRDLRWVDATDVKGIAYGWNYDDSQFTTPIPFAEPRPAE